MFLEPYHSVYFTYGSFIVFSTCSKSVTLLYSFKPLIHAHSHFTSLAYSFLFIVLQSTYLYMHSSLIYLPMFHSTIVFFPLHAYYYFFSFTLCTTSTSTLSFLFYTLQKILQSTLHSDSFNTCINSLQSFLSITHQKYHLLFYL